MAQEFLDANGLNTYHQGVKELIDAVLPSVSSADEGRVLSVDSSGAWNVGVIADELPAVTTADEGKILAVDSSGSWNVGEVSAEYVSLTWAEYQALPSSKYTDNTVYFITDRGTDLDLDAKLDKTDAVVNEKALPATLSAEDVPYGNTNVKSQLDDLSSGESGTNYTKLADGTLIQWGVADGYKSGATKTVTVNLLIAFLNTDYTVTATGSYGSDPTNYEVITIVRRISASQFEVHCINTTSTYTNSVQWIAIGRWK